VKLGPRDRGPEDGPWTARTWTCRQASVQVRMVMVMETVLTEVKTVIGSSQHGHTSTCDQPIEVEWGTCCNTLNFKFYNYLKTLKINLEVRPNSSRRKIIIYKLNLV
jgi:hypothetical protein